MIVMMRTVDMNITIIIIKKVHWFYINETSVLFNGFYYLSKRPPDLLFLWAFLLPPIFLSDLGIDPCSELFFFLSSIIFFIISIPLSVKLIIPYLFNLQLMYLYYILCRYFILPIATIIIFNYNNLYLLY